MPPDQLGFDGFEEGFHRGVIIAITFARELIAGAPQTRMHGSLPDSFNEKIFLAQLRKDGGYGQNEHPMCFNQYPLRERFSHEIDARVAVDLASGLAVPTKEEHLVARLSLLPDCSKDEVKIAAALNAALRWGRPMEGAKLQQERARVLQELGSVGDIDQWEAQDLLARVYRSYTYPEIRALAEPERDLPRTMRPIDEAVRQSAADGYAQSAQVANDLLSDFFLWTQHMRRHGLGITQSQSMSRGIGMSM